MITKPKKVLDLSDYKRIETMAAHGVRIESQARILGLEPRTFERILKRDKEAKKHFNNGKAKAETLVTNKLFSLIEKGHPSAIFFYLKTQCRWKETSNIEVTQEKPKKAAPFKFVVKKHNE